MPETETLRWWNICVQTGLWSTWKEEILLCSMCTLYTQPKGNFIHFFVHLHFDCDPPHGVECGIFYLWCHVCVQEVSDFRAFQNSGFQIWDAQLGNQWDTQPLLLLSACFQLGAVLNSSSPCTNPEAGLSLISFPDEERGPREAKWLGPSHQATQMAATGTEPRLSESQSGLLDSKVKNRMVFNGRIQIWQLLNIYLVFIPANYAAK